MNANLTTIIKQTLMIFLILMLAACGGGGDSGDSGGDPGGSVQDPGHTDDPGDDLDPGDDIDEQESSEDIARRIHSLGIGGAQGFVITGDGGEVDSQSQKLAATDGTVASDELDGNTLYKVTQDGRLERVPFSEDDGSEMDRGTIRPTGVFEVGTDFVYVRVDIVTTHEWGDSTENFGLLVNKSTGLAFWAEDIFVWHLEDTRPFTSQFRFDQQGNIFLRQEIFEDDFWGNFPVKVDISNLGSGDLTATPLQTVHDMEGFELSDNGETLAYRGRNSNNDVVYAVYDSNEGSIGLIRNLDGAPSAEPINLFLGLDGELYLSYRFYELDEETWEDEYDYPLYRLVNDAGTVTAVEVGQLDGEFTSGADTFDHYGNNYNEVVERLSISGAPAGFSGPGWAGPNGRMVINGRLMYFNDALVEVDIPNRMIVEHDEVVSLFETGKSLEQYPTDRHLWLSGTADADGNSLIVRYNPVTQETTTLPFEENFELHKFEPLDAERVMFEGIRLADQAKVVGQMNITGEIIEQTTYATEMPVTVLRAILPTDFIRIDGSAQDWDTAFRVLSGLAGGPDGDDLVYYSEASGRGEYFGLLEFEGSIESDHYETHNSRGSYTRINFDTHAITMRGGAVEVTAGGGEPVDALAEGSSIATGQAMEFAIPESLLGDGAQPVLQSVERYMEVLYGAIAGWGEEWVEEDPEDPENNAQLLRVHLNLGSPLGEQMIDVMLTEGYRVEVTTDSVTLFDAEDVSTAIEGVEYPVDDVQGETVTFTIHESAFVDPSLVQVDQVLNMEGTWVEEQLDILQ